LLTLRLAMKEIYAEWAFASAQHERLATQAERVEALAAREHERERRGETSGLEARRLDLAASGLQTRVALAAAASEQARSRAAGWNPSLLPGARPELPILPAAPESINDHPSVRAAQKDLAAAELERKAAGRFVRTPEVTLGWQRQEDLGASIDGPVLGVAWSLPVLARGGAEKAASESRVAAARARLERVRREIEAARSGALAAFDRLAVATRDARAALSGNERTLDGAEAAFRLGETSLTDLLEIHRSVTESELAVLDLRRAALAAHRELERATGDAAARPDPSSSDPETDDQESHR
jgi:outer membrane protein TolC